MEEQIIIYDLVYKVGSEKKNKHNFFKILRREMWKGNFETFHHTV